MLMLLKLKLCQIEQSHIKWLIKFNQLESIKDFNSPPSWICKQSAANVDKLRKDCFIKIIDIVDRHRHAIR